MHVNSIFIKFFDNDFATTFLELLYTIKRAIVDDYECGDNYLTEEVIKKLIHQGILFHYLAFQCKYSYACWENTVLKNFNNMVIMLNDEADKEAIEVLKDRYSNGDVAYLNINSDILQTM